MSKLNISEIFHSIQGEGINAGKPAIFIRVGRCNLSCKWCDEKIKWKKATLMDVSTILSKIIRLWGKNNTDYLVLTGGEPLLQQEGLCDLLKKLKKFFNFKLEVETNGTIAPCDYLRRVASVFTVSLKLANSGNSFRKRFKQEPLHVFSKMRNAFFKFVIIRQRDIKEVNEIVRNLNIPQGRVFLMPKANTKKELLMREHPVKELAETYGYRYSTRLHLKMGWR